VGVGDEGEVSSRRRVDTDGRALTQLTLQERRERLERLVAVVRRSVGATLVVALSWSRRQRQGRGRATIGARDPRGVPLHSVPAKYLSSARSVLRRPSRAKIRVCHSRPGSTSVRMLKAHAECSRCERHKKPAALATGCTSHIMNFPNLAELRGSARQKMQVRRSFASRHVRSAGARSHPRARCLVSFDVTRASCENHRMSQVRAMIELVTRCCLWGAPRQCLVAATAHIFKNSLLNSLF